MKHLRGMLRLVVVFAFTLVVLGVFAAPAHGQDVGSLQGTVTDPTGAAAGGARVTATDLSSSTTHVTTTDKSGSYSFTQLAPSSYKVEIVKEGFKTFVQAKVSVLVATPTLLDARLELGAVTQQVIVRVCSGADDQHSGRHRR